MTASAPVIDTFRKLHESGCFVIPNPWDIGSARWLRGQGFKALATTSAGFAFTQGRADQDVPLGMMLASAAANALSGEIDQARRISIEALRLNPSLRLSTLREYFVLRRPQDMERLIDGLRLAGLPE